MTPMLRQYVRWKEAYPEALLFFRMGDFYEMFFDDARVAAPVLDIALTARDQEKRIPMAGVPVHAVETYMGRLVEKGYSVAICEQCSEPDGRTLVERRVIRLVTPGTYVPEKSGRDGVLAAVAPAGAELSVAFLRPATGRLEAGTFPSGEAMALCASMSPAETLLPRTGPRGVEELVTRSCPGTQVVERERASFDPGDGERRLLRAWGLGSVEGFGLRSGDQAVGCAAALLEYLEETQYAAARHVRRIRPLLQGRYLHLDVTTQRNLELLEGPGSTLLSILDRTRTAMGRRMLRSWIERPLREVDAITRRHDRIDVLRADSAMLLTVQERLAACRDVERALGRLSLGVGTGRDMTAVRDTLRAYPGIRDACSGTLPGGDLPDLEPFAEVAAELERALAEEPPRQPGDGTMIRQGYDAELDEYRSLGFHGDRWLEEFAAVERERLGIKNLKVGYNKVFGYYIEVRNTQKDKVPEEYQRKQTLVSGERFITEELKGFEEKVFDALEKIRERERTLYDALVERVLALTEPLQELGNALAELDVLAAAADLAWEGGYVRPEVNQGERLSLRGARHPVVEMALPDQPFTPNDVELDSGGERIAIVTGPNMAGKSTFLRTAALHVILAQMGWFVPAEAAVIPVTDRIFTRIGARDELDRGQSTFMVEMLETANILHNVTEKSFVVLDEIGRGTSTYDGMSIAWAVLEYLVAHCGCRPKVLFATHYHELTDLAERCREVVNLSMDVDERADGIVFLHRVVRRPADRSYGIEVARLAGIPDQVIARSRELLQEFEEGQRVLEPPQRRRVARGGQMRLLSVERDALLEELASLDARRMDPDDMLKRVASLTRRSRRVLREGV
ncbi:MAG: DNA mismatch repair protein MutS [Synergistales bacterium]|nr:DNA mismatch repair protein MutS [Synergistales bacterium]